LIRSSRALNETGKFVLEEGSKDIVVLDK